MKTKLFYSLILLVILNGCQKDDFQKFEKATNTKDNQKIDLIQKIPSPSFEWENVDFIQNPDGTPSQILLPWVFQSPNIGVPNSFKAYTHPRNDGWKLLYNTFGVTGAEHKFFALYNQFTGIVRLFYYYQLPGDGSKVFYGLKTILPSVSLSGLSYDTNPMQVNTSEETWTSIAGSAGLAQNNWYATEYQMYYDPTFANYANNQQYFEFFMWKSTITQASFTGTQVGTIGGSIEMKASSLSLIKDITIGNNRGGDVFNVLGRNENVNLLTAKLGEAKAKNPLKWATLWQKITSSVNTSITDGLESVASKIIKGGFDIASNPVSYLVKSILGSSNSQTGAIKLAMNTKITLTGEMVTTTPVVNFMLDIPKTSNVIGGVTSTTEMDNLHMGLWSCSVMPEVDIVETRIFSGTTKEFENHTSISFKNFSIVTNPEIQFLEVKKELLLVGELPGRQPTPCEFVSIYPENGKPVYRINNASSVQFSGINVYNPKIKVYLKLRNTLKNEDITYSNIFDPKINYIRN